MLAGVSLVLASTSLNDRPLATTQTPSPSPTGQSLAAPTPAATPDNQAPHIQVTQPGAGATIYTSSATLRGHTEAGADMDVLDEATGEHLPVEVDPQGRFAATIPLTVGHNWLTLTSHDQANNVGHLRVDLVRTASAAGIELTVDPTRIDPASLPQQVKISAAITDDLGKPADNIPVTFSVSPPNAATMTYATNSVHGVATWPEFVIGNDSSSGGQWLVTVLADLPSGNELSANTSVNVR